MKKYEPTKREIEVDALKVAIKKTEVAQLRAQETLYRLAEKKERQKTELLLQSMFSKFDRKSLVVQSPKTNPERLKRQGEIFNHDGTCGKLIT